MQTADAQSGVEFELKLPHLRKKDKERQILRVNNSFYDHIDFLDSRPSPVVGPIIKNVLRGPVDLVLKQPIEAQLNTILGGLIDSTAAKGALLFQLRRFYYVETFPTEFCFLQATIYDETGGQYRKLLTMDTVFLMQTRDVLDYMNGVACPIFTLAIRAALRFRPVDMTVYDFNAVSKMDSIERSKLPVFADSAWVNGAGSAE